MARGDIFVWFLILAGTCPRTSVISDFSVPSIHFLKQSKKNWVLFSAQVYTLNLESLENIFKANKFGQNQSYILPWSNILRIHPFTYSKYFCQYMLEKYHNLSGIHVSPPGTDFNFSS